MVEQNHRRLLLKLANKMVAPSSGHFLQQTRHRAWRGLGAVHMPHWMQNSTSRWLRGCVSCFNNKSLWHNNERSQNFYFN